MWKGLYLIHLVFQATMFYSRVTNLFEELLDLNQTKTEVWLINTKRSRRVYTVCQKLLSFYRKTPNRDVQPAGVSTLVKVWLVSVSSSGGDLSIFSFFSFLSRWATRTPTAKWAPSTTRSVWSTSPSTSSPWSSAASPRSSKMSTTWWVGSSCVWVLGETDSELFQLRRLQS